MKKMQIKLPFILIAIVLMSYIYSSINFIGFAYVDDKWMLLDEKLMLVERFNWDFVVRVFTNINSLQYSPLNTLYYYFIYQIDGYNPYYFHLFSFILHVSNVFLIFLVVRRTLRLFDVLNVELLAYGIALTWGILPFNVEAVIWISASKIPLYTFFGLVSFIFFIDGYLKKSKYLYLVSLFTFTLSFLAKEQAVLFPIMMAAFLFAYERRVREVPLMTRVFRYTFPFLLLAFIFGLITLYTVIYGGGSHDIDRHTFGHRIILSFYCVCFYLFNTFIPINLHYHYPFPISSSELLPFTYYLYPVFLSVILWQLFTLAKRNPNFLLLAFGFSIFIIHLLLCIQVVPLARAAMMADRYMYMPSLGLIMIVGLLLNEQFEIKWKHQSKFSAIFTFSLVIYTIYLTVYSHSLVNNWKNMQI